MSEEQNEKHPCLGIDDRIWNTKFVYCGSHLRVHSTGWCSVSNYKKIPLLGDTLDEAKFEFKMRRFDGLNLKLYEEISPKAV